MTATNDDPRYLTIGPCPVAFPAFFEPQPKSREKPDEKVFQALVVFPADYDLTPVRDAALAAAREKWGDSIPRFNYKPIRKAADGDSKTCQAIEQAYPGASYIRVQSKYAPGVVDRKVQPVISEEGKSLFRGGVIVNLAVGAFAYDTQGNKGVSFNFSNVQYVRDGEHTLGGGGRAPSQAFTPLDDASPIDGTDFGETTSANDAADLFG